MGPALVPQAHASRVRCAAQSHRRKQPEGVWALRLSAATRGVRWGRCHRRATGASSLPGAVAVCFLFAADSFLVFCLVSTCFATADFFVSTFTGSFASSSAFFFAALIVNSFAASSDSKDWLRKTFGTRIVMPKVLW